MKRYIILLAALSIYSSAMSQNSSDSILGAKVDVESFEYKDDSVKLNIKYNFENLNIGVNESAVFRPIISRGGDSLSLSTVVVKRRGSSKAYNRANVLGNKQSINEYDTFYGDPYQIVEYYGSNKEDNIEYQVDIPYQTWMVGSQISVDCATYGCCFIDDKGTLLSADNVLNIDIPNVEVYEVNPEVEFVKPQKVAVKRRDIEYSSSLIFKVNSTYIDSKLEGNSEELASIDEMMQSVISDGDYTITKVNIVGYASPEGSLAANMRLSEGRAAALKNLMSKKYTTIDPKLYSVRFGGENWDKLYEIVSSFDTSWRDEVLNIIDTNPEESVRERKLMSLNGGEPYRYLLKDVYPATRLVVVNVEYNIDAYDIVRIGELIDTKPENLSLEEMYRLSENYTVEDSEFEKIFLTAARIYSDDETALNNALVAEIKKGNISSLKELSERVDQQTELAELANSVGAYYMIVGDYDMATDMLQRAITLGSVRAKRNMTMLDAKIENMELVKENEDLKRRVYGQ